MEKTFTIEPGNTRRACVLALKHCNTANRSKLGKWRRGRVYLQSVDWREYEQGESRLRLVFEMDRAPRVRILNTGERWFLCRFTDHAKLLKRLTELSRKG